LAGKWLGFGRILRFRAGTAGSSVIICAGGPKAQKSFRSRIWDLPMVWALKPNKKNRDQTSRDIEFEQLLARAGQ
jgi:hypothetical protein